ncbi:hypothetical protein [Brochothrix thermosphacta]|uniref:hypothetical protein n=1 Tax=Brochothrix thermosphacta TaxID=2756 RepID=UPI001C4FAAF1|nr:hypothetical protein [Brochothrix thermosphacta]
MLNHIEEKNLRKLHEIGKLIAGPTTAPNHVEALEAKKELEVIYSGDGRINQKYAKETLIAYEYSKTKFHFSTGNSMLKDIVNGKIIYFFHYI